MNFLADILERKRAEVAARRKIVPDRELESRLGAKPATRSLRAMLSPLNGPVRVVAEVKRASPSAGSISSALNPVALAGEYERSGASAISVLTDGPGFGGSLEDLRAVRAAVSVPLLRKDFIVDRYQLLEARDSGADVVLLIVAALPSPQLAFLQSEAMRLGLETLVEVHDEAELDAALEANSPLIGINNRNLKTFEVNLETTERLLPRIGFQALAVAESGIKGPQEIVRLRKAGAANFLVGEALVRAPAASAALREMLES